ncbi:MAG TPA: hypothetical protein VHI71_05040 [Actinomycetota bacterium]|nr:hypothetical protein [Actinomycetota bacterium]
MKKVVGLTTAALLGFSMLTSPSSAAPKQQTVEGEIAMMAPFYGDTFATCYSGLHRRASVLSGGANNGIVGFEFEVEPYTIGKPFVLEVTGGQGDVDLDITFYTEFGTTEQALDRTHAPPNYSFEERGAGGESGIIPKTAGLKWTKAIVCMHTGAGATFTYTAGKGVKLPS